MFDVSNRQSYHSIRNLYKVPDLVGRIPMVLCGNKVDLSRRIEPKDVRLHKKWGLPYCDISIKEHFNTDKPILWLIRALVGSSSALLLVFSLSLFFFFLFLP